MTKTRRAFVLSDLHLGPGGALTTFHEAARLRGLLDAIGKEGAVELLLAGDVFDFLQVDGYDGFSAAKAPERLETIARNPDTASVLEGLKGLTGKAGVEITVLAGNHDPELLVDGVREAFAGMIGRKVGSIRWADDDAPLVATDGEHPAVHGRRLEAVVDGDRSHAVWVVHGDRWDPSNHIDRGVVRAAAKADAAVQLPVGSHLVFEVLSKLKRDHRWVDELKPELTVVLPLLLAIEPRLTMRYLREHFRVGSSLVASRVRAALRRGPLFDDGSRPPPTDTVEADPVASLVQSLGQAFADVPESERDVDGLVGALETYLDRGPAAQGPDLLAGPSGARGYLLRAWLRAVRATDRFGDIAGNDSTTKDARRYLRQGPGALVAGHTHGARIRADLTPPYFNSGTWVPVRTLPSGDLKAWLDEVTDPDARRAPSPGTYVRIDLVEDARPRVAVMDWPTGSGQ